MPFSSTHNALSATEERLLMCVADRHEDLGFKLTEIDLPLARVALQTYLKSMVSYGLMECLSPGDVWRLTPRGLSLADLLSGIHLAKTVAAEEAKQANIANPKKVRRLSKRDKWEMDHHYVIADLQRDLQNGDADFEIEDDTDEYFTEAVYTDGTFTLSLGVTMMDIRDGNWDSRFTHVLVVYPNAEDK